MKSLKWILPLLTLCIMLGGCPYNSEVPIDKPSIKINPALLGTWKLQKSEGGEAEKYKVAAENEFTYTVDQIKQGKDPIPFEHYKAYLSAIDGDTLLNLWGVQEKGTPPNYTFYKLVMSADRKKVTLLPVTENITETFTKSEVMKEFFRKYKNLSFFYGKDVSVLNKE